MKESNIPDGWKKIKLKDILIEGSKEKVDDTSKYQKLTIKLNFKGMEKSKVRDNMADRRPFYIRRKGEIVIGKQNYFNGSIAILPDELDGGICSNAIMSFTTKEGYYNKYIYYMLSDMNFINRRSFIANGTGQKELSEKDFLEFDVIVPEIEEQKRIVKILSNIDKIILAIDKTIYNNEEMKKYILNKIFNNEIILKGNNNCSFDTWEEMKLGQIINRCRLGGNYSNTTEKNNSPLIKMGNLDRGKIKIDKIEYIDQIEKIDNNDLLKYGDILFNTRNTPELVGKVAIWKSELPVAYYNSNLLLLNFDEEIIHDKFYANYLLNTQSIIKKFAKIATGTTSVAAIYTNDLLNVKVLVSKNKEEQNKIASIVENFDKKSSLLYKKKENYNKLKQMLMQQLLTGKIRVKV